MVRKIKDQDKLYLRYPEVSTQWHPIKNGNLTPNDVSYASNKKVFWKCSKCNEEYEMPILDIELAIQIV